MPARMKNPGMIVTDAMPRLTALGKVLPSSPIPERTRHLVHVRTSEINGRAACLDGKIAKTTETPRRLGTLAVWQEASFFSDAERAALALAEAITRLTGPNRVPDTVWAEAARHYDESELAWLVIDVAVVNHYNRVNVSTRQVAGTQRWWRRSGAC